MNNPAPELANEPLLFEWESRRRAFGLVSFLALSLLLHALCFYVFQIVYPPTVTLLPPPARVALITPATEEGRTLLRWIEAEDPALAFTTHRPPEARARALPKIEHVPSYLTAQPTLREIPAREVDLRIPSSQPPGLVRLDRGKSAPPAALSKTTVSFSEEIARLGAPTVPELRFVASSEEAPETLRFRVAVNRQGEVRYCFPVNSSGDPALDEQARLFVARCRFPAAAAQAEEKSEPLIWGIAAVEWGNDVAASGRAQKGNAPP